MDRLEHIYNLLVELRELEPDMFDVLDNREWSKATSVYRFRFFDVFLDDEGNPGFHTSLYVPAVLVGFIVDEINERDWKLNISSQNYGNGKWWFIWLKSECKRAFTDSKYQDVAILECFNEMIKEENGTD